MLNKIEHGIFVELFNRGGYVLDFTTAGFDAFSLASVGIALCERYQLSKGKSLISFVQNENNALVDKLLLDLFDYYEAKYVVSKEDENPFGELATERKYASVYKKCREYADRERATLSDSVSASAEYLDICFNNDYLKREISSLVTLRTTNPTDAIGKSKELIESCCKTILEGMNFPVEKGWDATTLVKKTMEVLKVDVGSVDQAGPEGRIVKQILGNLRGVATGIIEFRNAYGSGHGKSASFAPLPARHAKLAVGCAVTLVEYLWETYEWRHRK